MNPLDEKVYPSLYSRDSKGKIREFYMTYDHDQTAYRTFTGLKDGKKTASGWIYPEATNVGRANERNPEQQALFEIDAEYAKKLKTGYAKTIEEIGEDGRFFPMLANKYKDLKSPLDFVQYEIFAQPKLDGLRNLGRVDGCFSRKAEEFPVLRDVHKALAEVHRHHPTLIFDGEMYSHDLADDLPKINSIVRKRSKLTDEDYEAVSKLQYHIYDVFDTTRPGLVFTERTTLLERLFSDVWGDKHPLLKDVETIHIEDQQHLDELYTEWRKENYEGQIIRHGHGVYQSDKRSSFLLKRKEYLDQEFKVKKIIEGKGNWAGAAKAAEFWFDEAQTTTFEAGLAGTYEENQRILNEAETYEQGEATVRFFKLSPYGIPIQGVVHAWYPEGRDV